MITKPHETYIPPTQWEIRHTMKENKLENAVSPEFISEATNLFSHQIRSGDIKEGFIDKEEYTKKEQEARRVLSSIDYSKFSEVSPVKSAIKLGIVLNEMMKEKTGKQCGKDQNPLDYFREMSDRQVESMVRKAQDTVELIDKIKPGSFIEKALNVKNDPMESQDLRKFLIPGEMQDLLDNVGKFDSMGSLKTKSKVIYKPNEFSKKKKVLPIETYSEVAKIPPSQMLLPSFQYKLLKKELFRAKGVDQETSKQIIFLLIDDSRSMSSAEKISRVKALLLNRLEQVSLGNTELFVCTFEAQLDRDEWIHVKDEKDAKLAWQNFSGYFRFSRGGTSIERSVTDALNDIKTGSLKTQNEGVVKLQGVNPEICVIHDGQLIGHAA